MSAKNVGLLLGGGQVGARTNDESTWNYAQGLAGLRIETRVNPKRPRMGEGREHGIGREMEIEQTKKTAIEILQTQRSTNGSRITRRGCNTCARLGFVLGPWETFMTGR